MIKIMWKKTWHAFVSSMNSSLNDAEHRAEMYRRELILVGQAVENLVNHNKELADQLECRVALTDRLDDEIAELKQRLQTPTVQSVLRQGLYVARIRGVGKTEASVLMEAQSKGDFKDKMQQFLFDRSKWTVLDCKLISETDGVKLVKL